MADDGHEHEDELLARVVGSLRALPPVNDHAVARIVDLAALQADGAPSGVSEMKDRRAARFSRAARWGTLGGLAVAAGLAGLLWVRGGERRAPDATTPTASRATSAPRADVMLASHRAAESAPVATQFVVDAPQASRVALVGDFNGWDPTAAPLARHAASGRWTITVPLAPGRHRYAFMVNDSVWTLDPRAPRATDPDFGTPNSVILVGTP